MHVDLRTAALSALTFSTLSSATIQKTCPTDGVCYSVAVPEASVSSGSGNLYFQIEGPTSYSWIALGTGGQMAGSNMFVVYTDGNGNVTVSPRAGTNHVPPSEDTSSTAADLTLLAGSGVDGSTMRANVLCTNCNKWSGGSMSLGSSSSSWVAAWKSGSSLDTTDKDASISQHDDTSIFSINLQSASVTADSNPFVASSTSDGSGSSSGGSSSSSSSGSGSNTGDSGDSGSSSSSSDSNTSSGTSSSGIVSTGSSSGTSDTSRLIAAHGIIMAITFVIMYPIGSILMPILGRWAIHAAWQMVSFILMWIGFGLGVVVSQKTFYNFTVSHTILGTVVVALMVLQPVLGFLQHRHYLRTQRPGGALSIAHIAYGRILMLLGVINGGLGLQLAGASRSLTIAYAVIAVLVGLAYVAVKLFGLLRGRRGGAAGGPVAAEKIGSHGSGGIGRSKYRPAGGEEIEMNGRDGHHQAGPRY